MTSPSVARWRSAAPGRSHPVATLKLPGASTRLRDVTAFRQPAHHGWLLLCGRYRDIPLSREPSTPRRRPPIGDTAGRPTAASHCGVYLLPLLARAAPPSSPPSGEMARSLLLILLFPLPLLLFLRLLPPLILRLTLPGPSRTLPGPASKRPTVGGPDDKDGTKDGTNSPPSATRPLLPALTKVP